MKMTKTTFMALASLAMLATSCCNGELDENYASFNNGKASFTVTQEGTGVTSKGVDATMIQWQSTDRVAVFDDKMTTATAPNEFTVAPDPSDATKATISGDLTEGSTSFVAVYPLSAAAESAAYSAEKVTVTIPGEQTATAGTVDPAAAVKTAVATLGETGFTFKNVCSFIKLETSEAYKEIDVWCGTGDIVGPFSVAPSTGVVTAASYDCDNTVILSPASGSTEIAPGTYYIALAPGTVTDLTIECYTDKTEFVKLSLSGETTLTNNAVLDAGCPADWPSENSVSQGTISVTVDASPKTGYSVVQTNDNYVMIVCWKKLWDFGPKFATINVGQTVTDYSSITTETYSLANVGGLYTWGGTVNSNGGTYSDDHNTGTAVLSGDNDIATKLWGTQWRMPTSDELINLKNNCTWTWCDGSTTQYVSGCVLKGYKVTGKGNYASNSVFFPAAGDYNADYGSVKNQGYFGDYWSSTPNGSYDAYLLNFRSGSQYVGIDDRSYGYSVRAVLR